MYQTSMQFSQTLLRPYSCRTLFHVTIQHYPLDSSTTRVLITLFAIKTLLYCCKGGRKNYRKHGNGDGSNHRKTRPGNAVRVLVLRGRKSVRSLEVGRRQRVVLVVGPERRQTEVQQSRTHTGEFNTEIQRAHQRRSRVLRICG